MVITFLPTGIHPTPRTSRERSLSVSLLSTRGGILRLRHGNAALDVDFAEAEPGEWGTVYYTAAIVIEREEETSDPTDEEMIAAADSVESDFNKRNAGEAHSSNTMMVMKKWRVPNPSSMLRSSLVTSMRFKEK